MYWKDQKVTYIYVQCNFKIGPSCQWAQFWKPSRPGPSCQGPSCLGPSCLGPSCPATTPNNDSSHPTLEFQPPEINSSPQHVHSVSMSGLSPSMRGQGRTLFDDMCLAVFPSTFAVFNLVYWSVVLVARQSVMMEEVQKQPWEEINHMKETFKSDWIEEEL